MLKEFKAFLTRGNVIDLAVAVVIGLAFQAVIKAVVADILTPIISIPARANFETLHFTVHGSTFLYGDVLNTLISFLAVAAAVFFLVVKPVNAIQARRARGAAPEDPTTRACPECLSDIPIAARRCSFCTSDVSPVDPPAA
jgi:large conductance mechanosensitive channel